MHFRLPLLFSSSRQREQNKSHCIGIFTSETRGLLDKEKTVLQGMSERTIKIERFYGMEIDVGRSKVMRISRQPSPIQIKRDKK